MEQIQPRLPAPGRMMCCSSDFVDGCWAIESDVPGERQTNFLDWSEEVKNMLLKGSCHCGAVQFQLKSSHPYPFNYCYCSVCRKTAGAGGYAINVSGDFNSLEVEGEENLRVYQARIDGEQSQAKRHFCMHCGSALWLYDPGWPELVHPHASAIDSELPKPPEKVHLMLGSKASWVEVANGDNDRLFEGYPDESIAQWHERLGLTVDSG